MTRLWGRTEAARIVSETTGYFVAEGTLRRAWERWGLVRLPYEDLALYDDVAMNQALTIARMRKEGKSLQSIRKAMGENGGQVATQVSAYTQLREQAREIQRDHVARYMKPLPDGDAMRKACDADPALYARYQAEVVAGGYDSNLFRRQLSEPAPVPQESATTQEIRRLRVERMAGDPKLTEAEADQLTFAERPGLYHVHRKETTKEVSR